MISKGDHYRIGILLGARLGLRLLGPFDLVRFGVEVWVRVQWESSQVFSWMCLSLRETRKYLVSAS